MGVSKVVYGDNTLVDLTNDSVSATTLAKGITAHNAAGDQVTGIMEAGTDVTKETITEALGYTPTKAWYVTFTTSNADNSVTADKTVAEIYQAYQDGYAVYGYITDSSYIVQLIVIKSNAASFTVVDTGADGIMVGVIEWDADNSKWVITTTDISSSSTEQQKEVLIVNITAGDGTEDTTGYKISVTSVDKTITEIYDAYTAGQIVIAKVNETVEFQLINCTSTFAMFVGTIYDGDCYFYKIEYTNGKWTYNIELLSVIYATKAEIPDETTLVNKVLAALPTWTGGSY